MALLTILLGSVVAICLGIILILITICHSQKMDMEQMAKPLVPPVKSWADAYYENADE